MKRKPNAMALTSIITAQLAGSIVVGVLAGMKVDEWLGTEPIFLIILLLLGLAAGVYAMLQTVRQYFS